MKLYRFEKLEKERYETLGKKQLWLSRASEFDDKNDCFIAGLRMPSLTKSQFDLLVQMIEIYYHEGFDYAESVLSEKVIAKVKKFIRHLEMDVSMSSDLITKVDVLLERTSLKSMIAQDVQSSVGVCCFFSGEIEEDDMWKIYADQHKGYCLEYEYSPCYESAIRAVNYVSQRHWNSEHIGMIESARELALCPEETLTRLVTSKDIEFEKEREYRFVEPRAFLHGAETKGKRVDWPDYLKPIRAIVGNSFSENDQSLRDEFIKVMANLGLEVNPLQ